MRKKSKTVTDPEILEIIYGEEQTGSVQLVLAKKTNEHKALCLVLDEE